MKSFRIDWSAYVFVVPAVLILGLANIYPIIRLLTLGFQETDVLSNVSHWVGFANFSALSHDAIFWKSARNTILYSLGVVPGILILSLALAFACQPMSPRFQRFARAALYLPGVVSIIVTGMVWTRIYDPQFGILNRLLSAVGVQGPAWLGDEHWALLAVSLMAIASGLGTPFILLATAMNGLPKEYHEVAEIEGAGAVHRFFLVTLPLIRPTLLYLVIILTIGSFQAFAAIFVMTEGGPNSATFTAVYLVYEEAFRYFDFGRAAALSVVLMATLTLLALGQFKWLATEVEY
jgi:multiple sugar transport system permease protein